MVWKPSEWKLAVIQARDNLRSMVEELFEAVANEENRLARMEIDGRLERTTARIGRKDIR
jgi:hypothetical protein